MPSCVDESTDIEIRFKPQAEIQPDELALLESILPELLIALMQEVKVDNE